MASIVIPRGQFVSVQATQANSTAAHTTTLGPFTIGRSPFNGLWLLHVKVMFGVPSAAINEDVLLQDQGGNTIITYHVNMGSGATVNPVWINDIWSLPGIVSSSISGTNQQSWNLVTPATVNGPGYSVFMAGYLV